MKRSQIVTLLAVIAVLLVLAGTGCGREESVSEVPDTVESEIDDMPGVQRRKIDRLDPKSFIEVTLELKREEKQWRDEWQQFMQEKRDEFFESFGISEKQFNDYPINNQREFQQFLRENAQYNQILMRMQQEDTYQP